MRYEDLTLNQRIAIKGYIQNEGKGLNLQEHEIKLFQALKAVWIMFNFKKAVNMFLEKMTL